MKSDRHRPKERHMPLINVKLIEGVFTSEQKTQIAERLTDAMVSVEGENMRGVTWCVIDEVKSGDWAIGGQGLTTEAVQALAAGQPAMSGWANLGGAIARYQSNARRHGRSRPRTDSRAVSARGGRRGIARCSASA